MATTSTPVTKLKINKLTKAQYDGITNPSATELYFVKDEAIDYNDLVNKPTIGDGNLVIQRNNSNVGSFNANDVNDNIINIDVPTQPSDIGAMPASTKYAASIKVTMNTSNYQVTFQLKDQGGSNIGSAQTIDLPIESVIVNGYYDANTKEVVLVLQNGTEIRFSVADLISGLQSEITPTNMLDSDLVDDSNAAHKFVTATDKTNWDNKVDKTSDTYRIYGTNGSGTQVNYKLATAATGSTIPYRDTGGTLQVGTPTADSHATTKKYVDDVDANKVDKVNTANKVYGTDANGNQTTYDKGSFGQVDDVKVGTTSVVTNKIANLGTMAGESTTDWQQKLTAGSGIDITNNIISAENVFIADYGTTSYADVKAAYDAGYQIIVRRNNFSVGIYVYYNLIYISNSPNIDFTFAFITVNGNYIIYHSCVLSSTNGWTTNSGEYIQKQLTSLSVNEGITGTSTTQRNVQANYLKQIIQGTTLTGISFADTSDVIATDSITAAIGKLQANVTDLHDNKQDNINDLSNIRSGAALGATAVQPADLGATAFSNDYTDLDNKPTIGDATLTIQKNGTTVATFSANATSNVTANILADEIKTDNVTISKDANDKLQAIGTLQKNGNTAKYDWIGTLAEYNALGSYNNNWLYYITDDNVVINPTTDDATIIYNADDELQAIGVIDKNTNAPKYDWIGTLAEYQAQDIETLHPNWLCYITDDMSGGPSVYTKNEVDNLVLTQVESQVTTQMAAVLSAIYPVGSIYGGNMTVNPLATLIPNSTWELLPADKALWTGDGTNQGTIKESGLPDHQHISGFAGVNSNGSYGVASIATAGNINSQSGTSVSNHPYTSLASATNNIYGAANIVQPPAYVINVWIRTA